jgi:hypothetical protein
LARNPYSLYPRNASTKAKLVYYVRFWLENEGTYTSGLSTQAPAERFGLEGDSFNPHLKSGSRRIVEACLRQGFEFTPRKTEVQRLKSYLLGFWNWETSAYVKGTLARKKNSIGRAHVQNNLSRFLEHHAPLDCPGTWAQQGWKRLQNMH